MKNFFQKSLSLNILFLFLALPFNTLASPVGKVLVFSDMDDTVKISFVRNKLEMVNFSVFGDSLFFGMNSVYQGLVATFGARFHYVSNGWKPTVAQTHGEILNNFNFPDKDNFYARDLRQIVKRHPHKFSTITTIALRESPDTIILVGDNGESDPEKYDEVKRALQYYYLGQRKTVQIHTFIHMVYKPKDQDTLDLYPGQVPFSNAGELAILLADRKLLKNEIARDIAKAVFSKIQAEGKNRVYGPLVNPFFKHVNSRSSSLMCAAFYSI